MNAGNDLNSFFDPELLYDDLDTFELNVTINFDHLSTVILSKRGFFWRSEEASAWISHTKKKPKQQTYGAEKVILVCATV